MRKIRGARTAAHRAGRIAGDDGPGLHIPGHHGPHANHGVIANGDTIDNADPGADPHIPADANTFRGHRLFADSAICIKTVVKGIEGAVGGNAAVIANLDAGGTTIQPSRQPVIA